MYKSDNLKQTDNETFTYIIDKHKDFKILQLTDLHLGFGFISRKKDKLALNAVTKIIHKAKPDMIVLTGDSIFPFLPKAGTLNNRKQAYKLMKFMDSFAIPYMLVLVIMIARWVRHVIRKNWHRFIRRGNTAYLLKAGKSLQV